MGVASKVIESDEVASLHVVRELMPWRQQLARGFGTHHGNADVQLIDVLIVMLAAFFNPLVRSQRLVEALSSQQWMKDQTGIQRIPKSTLSDALARFDPEQLRPLIQQLVKRVPALGRRDADLAAITRQIIAADGSHFHTAVEVAWAMSCGGPKPKHDQVRWNLQLDVDSFTPVDCDISGLGDGSEPKAFMRRLQPNLLYVFDRNFRSYELINAVLAAPSSFVMRVRSDTNFQVHQSLPLGVKDAQAEVRSDERVHFAGAHSAGNQDYRSFSDKPPQQTLRRVVVWDQKNKKEVILLTDLLDVPAYAVGAIYRQRWQIELFFKWIKAYVEFDHLISHHPNGVQFQFYVAVIATLLLHLATGRRVSKYALFWLGSVAAGHATFEEMQEGLARIEREKERERERRKRAAERKKIGK